MKRFYILISGILLTVSLAGQNFQDLQFGTDSTLEVMSWNIEWFPKSGQTTISNVSAMIPVIDADVIAMQEVDSYDSFVQMMDELEGWDGYAVNSEYLSLAFIYKTSVVEDVNIYPILTNKNRELPRSPLVMEMRFAGQDYVIINNHLKCCGDGILDLSDPWDEETRRYDACHLLDEYISTYFSDQMVFLVGDLNDLLTDESSNNVFSVFLADPVNYLFTDMTIAEGPSSGWSYPSWPSHLDHILITSELFGAFESESSEIITIQAGDAFANGFWEYDQEVSDHLPVAVKVLPLASSSGIVVREHDVALLNAVPNPCSAQLSITLLTLQQETSLEVFDILGKKVMNHTLPAGSNLVKLNVAGLQGGVYQFIQKDKKQIIASGRFIRK